MILRIILFNELEGFLPQGGVRRRPKKVPLSFSALARGALQAPGCAEDRHSPPAGPPEGRRRQWCARRIDDERTWVKQKDLGETKRYEGVVVQKSSLLNKEIQRGRGSWFEVRGSKIQNVLFCLGYRVPWGALAPPTLWFSRAPGPTRPRYLAACAIYRSSERTQ